MFPPPFSFFLSFSLIHTKFELGTGVQAKVFGIHLTLFSADFCSMYSILDPNFHLLLLKAIHPSPSPWEIWCTLGQRNTITPLNEDFEILFSLSLSLSLSLSFLFVHQFIVYLRSVSMVSNFVHGSDILGGSRDITTPDTCYLKIYNLLPTSQRKHRLDGISRWGDNQKPFIRRFHIYLYLFTMIDIKYCGRPSSWEYWPIKLKF